MKETARDAKLYARALDRASQDITPPALDETHRRYARRIALDAIMAFEEEVDAMRKVEDDRLRDSLRSSREKFAFYADQHRAKNTEDSIAKAVVNEQMVAMISLALGEK